MARGTQATPRTETLVAIAAVAALAIVVGALSLFAIERANPRAIAQAVAPATTFDETAAPSPSPTSMPTTMAPSPVMVIDRSVERFLSIGSQAMWRGAAGACGGVEPLVERSTDSGATWVDVTARYRQLSQVAALDAFTPTEGQLVAGVGTGCEVQALRTFTQGQFWEQYADVLAASSYIDLANPSTVITPAGALSAPCATATGLRSAGTRLAVVCDGQAYTLDPSRAWQTAGIDGVVAVAFSAEGLLVGHSDPICAGVAVSLAVDGNAPIVVGCAASTEPAGAIAIATDGARVVVWAEDGLVEVVP